MKVTTSSSGKPPLRWSWEISLQRLGLLVFILIVLGPLLALIAEIVPALLAGHSDWLQLAIPSEAIMETPEANGIYIACGVWGGPPVAQCLEAEFGKPVVFDDTQFYWAGLKALNIRLPVKGLGKLFEIL